MTDNPSSSVPPSKGEEIATGRGYKPSSTKKRDPAADAANRQLDNPDSHENHHR